MGRGGPALRHLVAGVERADSWATDCHKWLNVPYDSGLVFVRDPAAHAGGDDAGAVYVTPGEGREPYRYVPEASRRARGFAVWAALRALGAQGSPTSRALLRARARGSPSLMAAEPGVEILNDVVLNQVLVRFGDSDAVTHDVSRRACRRTAPAGSAARTWHGSDADAVLDHELVDDGRATSTARRRRSWRRTAPA